MPDTPNNAMPPKCPLTWLYNSCGSSFPHTGPGPWAFQVESPAPHQAARILLQIFMFLSHLTGHVGPTSVQRRSAEAAEAWLNPFGTGAKQLEHGCFRGCTGGGLRAPNPGLIGSQKPVQASKSQGRFRIFGVYPITIYYLGPVDDDG